MSTKISVILAALSLLPLSVLRASPISDQSPVSDGAAGVSQSDPANERSLLDVAPVGIEGAPISDGIDLPPFSQPGSPSAPAFNAFHPNTPFSFPGDSLFPPGEPTADGRANFQDSGLKQVLRSIATVRRSDYGNTQPRQAGIEIPGIQPEDFNDGQDDFGLSHIILDNATAVNALRKAIDIRSTSDRGTVFSIFGMGEFMLETMPGSHETTLSELSSGRSVTLSSGADSGGQSGYNQNPDDQNENRATVRDNSSTVRRLLNEAVDFVTSPLAILLAMIVLVIMALWGTVRTIASLRTQAAFVRDQQPAARRTRSRSRNRPARRSRQPRELRPPAQ